ncbi:MAG TPA: hypothetical protein VKS19_10815 [Verrucomicrobiae bacterium]|nr:hypothetical protein [Verrucomicrobiae bacterium]
MIKFILGISCIVAALLPASLALLGLSYPGDMDALPTFCLASIMTILAASLVGIGWFLITRRGLPMSRKAKVLTLLPLACFGIIVVAAIPNFIKARNDSAENACLNNLRQLDAAVKTWQLTNEFTTPPTTLNTNGISPHVLQ